MCMKRLSFFLMGMMLASFHMFDMRVLVVEFTVFDGLLDLGCGKLYSCYIHFYNVSV